MKNTYQIIAEYYNSRGFLVKKEIFNDPETSIQLFGLDEDTANKYLSIFCNLYFGKTIEIDNQKCYYCFYSVKEEMKMKMKKYTIKELTWTEVEKNNFVSCSFNGANYFRVWSGFKNWYVKENQEPNAQKFSSKEFAIEWANNRYQEIAKEFLEEVED